MCPRCKSIRWDVPKIRRPPYRGGGLGIQDIIGSNRSRVRALVRKYHFSNPRVFGSLARSEAGPTSDVDLLVKARGGGLIDRAGLSLALEKLLGRRVDIATEGGLKWYAAPEILVQAVPV